MHASAYVAILAAIAKFCEGASREWTQLVTANEWPPDWNVDGGLTKVAVFHKQKQLRDRTPYIDICRTKLSSYRGHG